MKSERSERKEAAEIVRRLDDAALRAKRGRGLDALKDWDTAEFDGFSARLSSGLEQLRHWDETGPSQVVPLTPLPLKDVPGIGTTRSLTAARLASLEKTSPAKGDLYQAEMPTAATPFVQPAVPPVSPPVTISQATSSPQLQPILSPPPAKEGGSAAQSRGAPLMAEPAQIRSQPLRSVSGASLLKRQPVLGTGAAPSQPSPAIRSTAEGPTAPAVRLTGAMGMALARNSTLTQSRLSTLSSSASSLTPSSAPRPSKGSREPKLEIKAQPNRPILRVKPGEAEDFTPAQRAGINAGITIGTGLALAAVTIWLLVWFVSQSMSMVMDSLRAFVQ